MKKYGVKTKKKLEYFVFVGTILVFFIGLSFIVRNIFITGLTYGGFNIYYLGCIFSIVMLFKALTEKGFNPGNYLFYCVLVLIIAMFLENIAKNMILYGIQMAPIIAILLVGSIVIGIISNYLYISTMDKGLKDLEGKEKNK